MSVSKPASQWGFEGTAVASAFPVHTKRRNDSESERGRELDERKAKMSTVEATRTTESRPCALKGHKLVHVLRQTDSAGNLNGSYIF